MKRNESHLSNYAIGSADVLHRIINSQKLVWFIY
jgi:hypothetical protein